MRRETNKEMVVYERVYKIIRKAITVLLVTLLMFSLTACGKEGTSKESNSKDTTKGTRENPYTMKDTITISSYAWNGNKYFDGTPIGTNTFEISNLRIESGEFSSYKGNVEDINIFAFDKKCIETCLEDGIDWLDTGNVYVDNFFNSNLQSIDYTDITEEYTKQYRGKVVYFEGTTYTEAYALCKIDGGDVITNDETYSLMRIEYFDENLDEQYVYISLEQ